MGRHRRIVDEIWDSKVPGLNVKLCRKETKRRFKALRAPHIPAEVVALQLLKARCARCPMKGVCWRP